MPTGYTAPVADGTVTKFPEFAMRCARAFGALVEMRDEAMGAPIPEKLPVSSYHQTAANESRDRLKELRAMSEATANKRAAALFLQSMDEYERSKKERIATVRRYNDMLNRVRAWRPPSKDHQGLKEFMVEQLTESLRYEGLPDESWKPKHQTGAAWLEEELDRTLKNIAYHEEQHAQDVKRAAERTEWVQQLRESLV